jgi:hypothetical protein
MRWVFPLRGRPAADRRHPWRSSVAGCTRKYYPAMLYGGAGGTVGSGAAAGLWPIVQAARSAGWVGGGNAR